MYWILGGVVVLLICLGSRVYRDIKSSNPTDGD